MGNLKIGLQLYSVRDDMAQDMYAALKKVKEIGYDYVEFAGYFDHSAEEVRSMLDEIGLTCVSVHQAYNLFLEEGQKAADYLKTIGADYAAIPWMAAEDHKGCDHYDNVIADITKVGRLLKDNGIQLLYHNHDFEFQKYDDKFLLDWLYESVSEDLLQTEVDTCWVKYAGYDPCEYLKKYTGRSPVVHLKDFTCKRFAGGPAYALIDENGKEIKTTREDNGFEFRPVGMGLQDFPAILKAAEEAGAAYAIVEQDASVDRPPMEAAKLSREYLKKIGY
ncbi:TIM barrel protein [Congzhengia sp.]|uniref:sugar phosphate isomerase/epimerase family protein n=1 Tax=Congzhengia sp. TaxID=2944168 RepID=UPI003077FFAE